MVITFALLFHYILSLAYLERNIRNFFYKQKKKSILFYKNKKGTLFESVILNSCFHLLILTETVKIHASYVAKSK